MIAHNLGELTVTYVRHCQSASGVAMIFMLFSEHCVSFAGGCGRGRTSLFSVPPGHLRSRYRHRPCTPSRRGTSRPGTVTAAVPRPAAGYITSRYRTSYSCVVLPMAVASCMLGMIGEGMFCSTLLQMKDVPIDRPCRA